MSNLVLHHFKLPPCAGKVRAVPGIKGRGWQGVQIALLVTKPRLTGLTRGYRKPPVMPAGADGYSVERAS